MQKILSLGLIAALTCLSGCAGISPQMKSAISRLYNSDIAYAEVYRIVEADSEASRKNCANTPETHPHAAICKDLKSYQLAFAAVYYDKRSVSVIAEIPKNLGIKDGSIIQVNPQKRLNIFERVAAIEPTDSCRWRDGPPMSAQTSATGFVTGFALGWLIVPAIAMRTTDVMTGGVVCEGWSYKTIKDEVAPLAANAAP